MRVVIRFSLFVVSYSGRANDTHAIAGPGFRDNGIIAIWRRTASPIDYGLVRRAGWPLELEAVVGAVIELGDRLGVAMPATRAVYACAKMLDEKRQR